MARAGSLALAHDALLPRAPGGMGRGALLALLVHAGLVVALTAAVDWRTQAPVEVSAELWASVPQSAAPPPAAVAAPPPSPPPSPPPAPKPVPAPAPAPPPAAAAPKPPEPDIALEQQKAEQARKRAEAEREREIAAVKERKRAEAEQARLESEKAAKAEKAEKAKADAAKAEKARAAAEKAAAEKQQAQAEEARLARQREENLKRMMGQAGNAEGRTGTAAQEAAPSAAYAGLVAARVRERLVYGGTAPETAGAEVLVRATASGTIIARQLTKSSGYADYDEAILRAIDKLNALPANPGGAVPSAMTLVFKRRE